MDGDATCSVASSAPGALPSAVFATDIYQNFTILEASNLSGAGGTFLQGGRFYGTFTVDASDVPTVVGASVALPAVDVSLTAGGGAPAETFTSGAIYLDAELPAGEAFAPPGEYVLVFSDLQLTFIEVLGTFEGGQVISADSDQSTPDGDIPRIDNSGDAVAIDPMFLAPEPGSIGMGGLGLAILAAAWRRQDLEPARADFFHKTK
jgi:hypothetical protein